MRKREDFAQRLRKTVEHHGLGAVVGMLVGLALPTPGGWLGPILGDVIGRAFWPVLFGLVGLVSPSFLVFAALLLVAFTWRLARILVDEDETKAGDKLRAAWRFVMDLSPK